VLEFDQWSGYGSLIMVAQLARAATLSRTTSALLLFLTAVTLHAESAVYRAGEVRLDHAGQPINAHGGGMLFYRFLDPW
jgi:hypothetical protein